MDHHLGHGFDHDTSFVLAWLIAIYLRFNKGRLAKIVSSLYIVPMFIPVVIASYALVEFWNDGGIGTALESQSSHRPDLDRYVSPLRRIIT
jgi:ABC-type spermidine/putrescine transport system permease subunit I